MNEGDGAAAQAEERAQWDRVRDASDPVARSALLDRHLPYARIVAASYYARRFHDEVEFDDYLQFARVGLLEAFDRYDPAGGAAFRTFAARRMHGAILDGIERFTEKQSQIALGKRLRADRLRSLADPDEPLGGSPAEAGDPPSDPAPIDDVFRRLAQVGIGLALGLLLDETGMFRSDDRADPGPCPAYRRIELAQTKQRMRQRMKALPDAERRVLHDHYLQGVPFDRIAQDLGVTKGRVSQIHKRALASLRASMAASVSCDVSY